MDRRYGSKKARERPWLCQYQRAGVFAMVAKFSMEPGLTRAHLITALELLKMIHNLNIILTVY